uniref:Dynein light chain n=1 Tax=Chrysemys picta bellii TaxID=8478 RepID=A0A8C3IFD4_CHRPI
MGDALASSAVQIRGASMCDFFFLLVSKNVGHSRAMMEGAGNTSFSAHLSCAQLFGLLSSLLFACFSQHTDMPEEMRVEAMELCVTACEKYATNNESAAKMIKETMDKKFGSSWHVVIGEGFGFEITHEVKNLLYMFFGGSLAVCVWKCS